MPEARVYLRLREGAFNYLLATDRTASIEHRDSGAFQPVDDAGSSLAAWHVSGDTRIPVVRLGRLMQTRAGKWEYGILLPDSADRIGLAAEHVGLVSAKEQPAVQPFNPAGCALADGPVITGLCRGTEPEHLVLDAARLARALRRAAGA